MTNSGGGLVKGSNNWELGTIIDKACSDFNELCTPRSDLFNQGAIILAKANYDCQVNFITKDTTNECLPVWSFTRIDKTEESGTFSTGFNFRTAQYTSADQQKRLLQKVYGIRVIVTIFGRAGKFGFVPLLVSLGAGIGLLGLASLITDFILQRCWPHRELFLNNKYSEVNLEEFDEDGNRRAGEYNSVSTQSKRYTRLEDNDNDRKSSVAYAADDGKRTLLPLGNVIFPTAPANEQAVRRHASAGDYSTGVHNIIAGDSAENGGHATIYVHNRESVNVGNSDDNNENGIREDTDSSGHVVQL